jgi:hypothetical protein
MTFGIAVVKQAADEFAWQYAWTKTKKRENKSLAVARGYLEWEIAFYRVSRRRPMKGYRFCVRHESEMAFVRPDGTIYSAQFICALCVAESYHGRAF